MISSDEKVSLIKSSSLVEGGDGESISTIDSISNSSSGNSESSSSSNDNSSNKVSKKESFSEDSKGGSSTDKSDDGAIVLETKHKKKKKKKKKKSVKKSSKKKKSKEREDDDDEEKGKKSTKDSKSSPRPLDDDDDVIFEAMLNKLVEGARAGSYQKLKCFIKDFTAHTSPDNAFLNYIPLLDQANSIISMLIAMINAPNNVPEALGAIFCLTRNPDFADIFAVTEGALSTLALFITDTALVQKKDRTKVDEYGIGILSNVGYSPEGKRKLVDLIPLPVFVRLFNSYYNHINIMKFAMNVLEKFRKSAAKHPFVSIITRKVIPTSGTDDTVMTVCCWCLRVLALNWRGLLQIRQTGGPTALLYGLQRCNCSRPVAMQAFPTLIMMFDEDNVDEYHGAYAFSVCSKALSTHVKDVEVLLRCLKLLDILLGKEGFMEEALDNKSLSKHLMKVVRKNTSSDSVVQLALGCVVPCARFSIHQFMGKVGGKKVIRKTLKTVKKSPYLSKATISVADELASICRL